MSKKIFRLWEGIRVEYDQLIIYPSEYNRIMVLKIKFSGILSVRHPSFWVVLGISSIGHTSFSVFWGDIVSCKISAPYQ